MVLNAIKKSFDDAKLRNWLTVFHFIDIHSTILIADYNNSSIEYYPYAKEVLQLLSNYNVNGDPNIVLCLWTCSYPEEIVRYKKQFEKDGIYFKYVNENPEVINTRLGCFDTKPYINVGYDDKFGFDPIEWKEIYEYLFQRKMGDKYIYGIDLARENSDINSIVMVKLVDGKVTYLNEN